MTETEEDSPPECFPGPMKDITGPWAVLYTLSRREKALARDLMSRAVPYFLPYRTNPPSPALLPLFPSIIFVSINQTMLQEAIRRLPKMIIPLAPTQALDFSAPGSIEHIALREQCQNLRESPHVFQVVHTKLQAQLRKELLFISQSSPASRATSETIPSPAPANLPVRITKGPLAGLYGHISPDSNRSNGRVKLTILLHLLGRFTTAEVHRTDLERLTSSEAMTSSYAK